MVSAERMLKSTRENLIAMVSQQKWAGACWLVAATAKRIGEMDKVSEKAACHDELNTMIREAFAISPSEMGEFVVAREYHNETLQPDYLMDDDTFVDTGIRPTMLTRRAVFQSWQSANAKVHTLPECTHMHKCYRIYRKEAVDASK